MSSLPAREPVRLLVYAPAFPTGEEKTPATLLAVTNYGWLVASETEDGAAALVKSDFSNTLFFELTWSKSNANPKVVLCCVTQVNDVARIWNLSCGHKMIKDSLIDYYSRRAATYEQIYSKPERQTDLHGFGNGCGAC